MAGPTDGAQRTSAKPAISGPRIWLAVEGLAMFFAGLVLYAQSGGNWILLVPLLLLPDVSMIGYVRGVGLGSFTYNLVHNWAVGFAVLAAGMWIGLAWLALLGAVLIAHVGMDRAVGYGLKYPTHFKDTHLQRV